MRTKTRAELRLETIAKKQAELKASENKAKAALRADIRKETRDHKLALGATMHDLGFQDAEIKDVEEWLLRALFRTPFNPETDLEVEISESNFAAD